MKYKILCVLICAMVCAALALWTEPAQTESCAHERQQEHAAVSEWFDYGIGHQWVETTTSVCEDCGQKISSKDVSLFALHDFRLAANIHCDGEMRHLYVHICADCHAVSMSEVFCRGGQYCYTYQAKDGEVPPVKQCESMDEWKAAHPEEAIVSQWLDQQGAE